MENRKPDITKLEALMERLRAKDGCPWDKEQTKETLTPFIIEEAYEVVQAIDSKDAAHIKEELGDLLFQVVFVSQIAKEKGEYTLSDVIDSSHAKMINRHPHVFGESRADTPEEVLPALLRAHKVSQKAARAGFDWKDVSEVLLKLDEEINEFKDAVKNRNAKEMEDELGDLFFTLVNVGRFLEVNPEDALRKTIAKFISRFHHIERTLIQRGDDLSSTPIDELERLWQEAKKREKKES